MINVGRPRYVFETHLQWAIDGAVDVLDIGTAQRFSKELARFRHLFDGKKYIAAGFHRENGQRIDGCDCHQDIQSMTFPDASFDTILCIEVLEHVSNPFLAASEIVRTLRPGGRLFLTTPFLTSYHGKGHGSSQDDFADYWRFTHQGLEQLFSTLSMRRVVALHGPIETRIQLMKCDRFLRGPLRKVLDRIDHPRLGKATSRHLLCGQKK